MNSKQVEVPEDVNSQAYRDYIDKAQRYEDHGRLFSTDYVFTIEAYNMRNDPNRYGKWDNRSIYDVFAENLTLDEINDLDVTKLIDLLWRYATKNDLEIVTNAQTFFECARKYLKFSNEDSIIELINQLIDGYIEVESIMNMEWEQ